MEVDKFSLHASSGRQSRCLVAHMLLSLNTHPKDNAIFVRRLKSMLAFKKYDKCKSVDGQQLKFSVFPRTGREMKFRK
jgi:hypothetical protein